MRGEWPGLTLVQMCEHPTVAIHEDIVSRSVLNSDMLDRELRIERDGRTFYVQAARRIESLGPPVAPSVGVVFPGVLAAVQLAWHGLKLGTSTARPWSIGVIEYDDLDGGRLIHVETLPNDVEPQARMRELGLRLDADGAI